MRDVGHVIMRSKVSDECRLKRTDSQDDTDQEGQEVRSDFQPFRGPFDRICGQQTHIDQQSDLFGAFPGFTYSCDR